MPDESRQLNLPQREEKILEFWERNKIFEKSLSKNLSKNSKLKASAGGGSASGGKTFVFYEGPPTANAAPGIHHLESRAFKDIIPRYKTMRGFFVPRKAGWDTHGLPVEIQVEKALGLKTKKDIEKYGVAEFNEKCRDSVWQFKKEWEESTKRIGFWLDLENPYITYETKYMESLWWIIKEIWKKKLLYQDFKVLPWCPRCQTGLSTHEVGQPGAYKQVEDRSIFVTLKLNKPVGHGEVSDREFLLVWTTTPWTLPANVAVAVNPKIEYTKYRVRHGGNEIFLWSATTPPFEKGNEPEVVERISGKALIGATYKPLFEVPKEYSLGGFAPFEVIAGDFVTVEDGTGMVHLAPAYGDEDMKAVKAKWGENYPIFHTISDDGIQKPNISGIEGKSIEEINTNVISFLEGGNTTLRSGLYKELRIKHDYPHCWRCQTPLLYFAKTSWWIRMTELKQKLLKNNSSINWIPEHIKEGRLGEFLREVRDWAFSRERFWGTPLPVWECRNCESRHVIGSLKELSELSINKPKNKYFLMRHGQAMHNILGEVGPVDPKFELRSRLALQGREEVEKTAKKIISEKIDLIFSSDLKRARETAEIVCGVLKKPVKHYAELRDYNVGMFHGMKEEEFHKNFDSLMEKFDKRVPGGESWNDVRKRMIDFVLGLEKKYSGKNILIISHGDPLWLLNAALLGLNKKETLDFAWYPETAEFKNVILPALPFDSGGEINIHRPYIDGVMLSCKKCGGEMKRVSEVIDVWFDSGSMPWASQTVADKTLTVADSQRLYALSSRKSALLYPADYIAEAVDQTRGWFYTLLAVATLLGKSAPYKNVISLGHVLDKNGQKMSKSKGNVVVPKEMIDKYGADTIRWYFYTINSPGEPKKFDEKDLQNKLRGFLGTLWNSFVFFDTYVDKIKGSLTSRGSRTSQKFPNSLNILNKWIALKLNVLINDVTKKLDKYDITGAARLIEEFTLNDFSNWYLRRSRRRFQKPKTKEEKEEAVQTTAYVLSILVKLCAPFVPFISDAIWQELRKKMGLKNESVHLSDWPKEKNEKRKAQNILKDMEAVRKIVAEALKLRVEAGIKVRQPLAKIQIPNSKFQIKSKTQISKELLDLIKEELNVKEIVFGKELKLDTAITKELKEEGMVREIVRNIQEMRKDLGLHPRDKIRAHFSSSKEVDFVLEKWKKFIMAEAGVKEFYIGGKKIFKAERDLEMDGNKIWVGIDKS